MIGSAPGEVRPSESARLTETCIGDPCIGAVETGAGSGVIESDVILGWLNENNRLTVRLISIDTDWEPINYDGSI